MMGKSMADVAVNTLDLFPPLTKTVLCSSNARMLVPLDAKQASPLSALGQFPIRSSCQVLPPSELLVMKNLPLRGSPTTVPLRSSQNSIASRNIPFVLFSYTTFQLSPPSSVFRM